MKFSIDKQEKYTLVHLDEEKLDSSISALLKTEFLTLNAEGVKNIILDLCDVKYADSSGLSAILTANRLCKQMNGSLVICGISNHVMKLIQISQLDKVFDIINTREEAIDRIFMNELESDFKSEESDS